MIQARFLVMILAGLALQFPLTVQAQDTSQTDPMPLRMPTTGWPCWRGPFGSGSAVDYPGELVADMKDAKLAWRSEDIYAPPYLKGSRTSGSASLVAWNGRIYGYYHGTSQDRLLLANFEGDRLATAKGVGRGEWCIATFWPKNGLPYPWSDDFLVNMTFNVHLDDVLVCIDAETGRTLWRAAFPSYHGGHSGRSHNNPCIATSPSSPDGFAAEARVYFCSLDALSVFCLDALTGEVLWRHDSEDSVWRDILMRKALKGKYQAGGDVRRWKIHSAVVDGYLVCPLGTFDARTGRYIRPGCELPQRWIHQGKEYLIDLATRTCFDVHSGKMLWKIEGSTPGIGPAISADYLVAGSSGKNGPFTCYRISPDGATKVWAISAPLLCQMAHSSPIIHRGFVHANFTDFGGTSTLPKVHEAYVCFELATGKIVHVTSTSQHGSIPPGNVISSSAAGNGWVFGHCHSLYSMVQPTQAGEPYRQSITRFPAYGYQGPSDIIADGRWYTRTPARIVCLDLRKNPPDATPPLASDPAVASLPEPVRPLGSAYRSDRERAIAALATADAATINALVQLLEHGNYNSQVAASEVIQRLGDQAKSVASDLESLLVKRWPEAPPARLACVLCALYAVDTASCVTTTRRLLTEAMAENRVADIIRLSEAIADRPGLSGLTQQLLPEFKKVLVTADRPELEAVGQCLADVDPEAGAMLAKELLDAIMRQEQRPIHGLRALANLAPGITDPEVALRGIDYCIRIGYRGRTNENTCTSLLSCFRGEHLKYQMAYLIERTKLYGEWISVIARIGDPALPALCRLGPWTTEGGKGRDRRNKTVTLLKRMGGAGQAAAAAMPGYRITASHPSNDDLLNLFDAPVSHGGNPYRSAHLKSPDEAIHLDMDYGKPVRMSQLTLYPVLSQGKATGFPVHLTIEVKAEDGAFRTLKDLPDIPVPEKAFVIDLPVDGDAYRYLRLTVKKPALIPAREPYYQLMLQELELEIEHVVDKG